MIRSSISRLACLLVFSCTTLGAALAPHEVVILVNENSPRSLEVANHYAHLRRIPHHNVIRLPLPASVLKSEAEMNEAEFLQHIWAPANEEILRRGIGDHVLAWIYSADFPVRITRATGSPVSLTGMTFMRNELPDDQLVAQGKYTSPLFCGPKTPQDRVKLAESFDSFNFKLGDRMPLPSMMLAYTGARGLSVDESLDVLRRGAAADGTRPREPVIFVKRDDIRSKCRDWQYSPAVGALASVKGRAEIRDKYPDGQKGLMGLFDGIHEIVPTPGSLMPGSVAEHLTSHAANFIEQHQTKLSVWLRAGATASSGTVAEPFAIGSKFASPFFFAHYMSGCSIIESYYLAVQCPLQLLMVGEPLAAPWAEIFPVTLAGMDPEGPLKGKVTFYTDAGIQNSRFPPRIQYFLDGVFRADFGSEPMLSFDSSKLPDGYHELRAVVRKPGPVAVQAFDERSFIVNNRNRSVNLKGISAGQKVDLFHAVEISIAAAGEPKETGLVNGEFRIPIEAGRFNPMILGAGPVRCQAYAVYDDGMEVRSEPVAFEIARMNLPPAISSLANMDSGNVHVSANDPDGDDIQYRWFRPLKLEDCGDIDGAGREGVFTPDADQPHGVSLSGDRVDGACEFSAEIMIPPGRANSMLHGAFLLFDVQDSANFAWFGAAGDTSAWTTGVCRDGKMMPLESFGAYIPLNTWIGLSVRRLRDGTVEGRVNGERVCVTAMQKPGWSGQFGFLVQRKPLKFRNPMVCIQDGGAEFSADQVRKMGATRLILRADDGFAWSEKEINLTGDENAN
ncbi:MAG: TIGR03790 family protein [Kiritimatiellia bacterium]